MENKVNNRKAIIVLAVVLVLAVAGIIAYSLLGKTSKTTVATENENNEQQEKVDNSDIRTTVDVNKVGDFVDGLLVLTDNTTSYVINTDFNVVWTFDGFAYEYKDGYFKIKDQDGEKATRIYDKDGNEKFKFAEFEYEKVELGSNGCLIITKKTDTYNSSSTTAGIYDIASGEYILGPKEEYEGNIHDKQCGMYDIYVDGKTTYFNTKTKQMITYKKPGFSVDFSDGYAIDGTTDSVYVYSTTGEEFELKAPNDKVPSVKEHREGIAYDNERNVIYNLKTKQVIDMSSQFFYTYDRPVFYDGKALVKFSNESYTGYYTVIDENGKFFFDPVRIAHDNTMLDSGSITLRIPDKDLNEGYIMADFDGVDAVLDYNNNEILRAQEGEEFLGVTNKCVKVRYKERGRSDTYYFKDLDGNRISIKK